MEFQMGNTVIKSKCGTCKDFIYCFNTSNTLLDIETGQIDEEMLKAAENIPACPEYREDKGE